MESSGTRSHWSQLSSDIWSTILLQVLNMSKWCECGSGEMHRLSAVCTSLRSIFQYQACLHEQILLRELSIQQIPSLLAYIHRHGHVLMEYQEYINHDSRSESRPVLVALLTSGAPLHTIKRPNPHLQLDLVSAFKMLRRCTLQCPHLTESVDLEPLRALPKLQHLSLQYGFYGNVQAAAIQLTTLELIRCEAHCAQQCQCVTSLEVLNMEFVELVGLHSDGLFACSQLKALKCICSSVTASNPRHSFDLIGASQCTPTGFTALTRLTHLEVAYLAKDHAIVDIEWVTQVQSLQVLRVRVVCDYLVLTDTLSCMTKIRSLTINAGAKHGMFRCSEVSTMLDWSALVSLREVHLYGTLRVLGQHKLSKLASLAFLHTIDIAGESKRGVVENNQLAELASELGRDRPHVLLSLNEFLNDCSI